MLQLPLRGLAQREKANGPSRQLLGVAGISAWYAEEDCEERVLDVGSEPLLAVSAGERLPEEGVLEAGECLGVAEEIVDK
jgi:hypothetical protein